MYCYDFKAPSCGRRTSACSCACGWRLARAWPRARRNKLILVFDHEGDSFMVVLDKTTGKEIWRAGRDEKTNWAAPLVVTFKGRTEVIVAGSNKVRSYELETGKVIWECAGLGANTIPQPVRQDDMVFVMTGYATRCSWPFAWTRGRPDGHRRRGVEPGQGNVLHAVAGDLREQALRADRYRHAELLQCQTGEPSITGAAPQVLQLQVLAGGATAPLPGQRE